MKILPIKWLKTQIKRDLMFKKMPEGEDEATRTGERRIRAASTRFAGPGVAIRSCIDANIASTTAGTGRWRWNDETITRAETRAYRHGLETCQTVESLFCE